MPTIEVLHQQVADGNQRDCDFEAKESLLTGQRRTKYGNGKKLVSSRRRVHSMPSKRQQLICRTEPGSNSSWREVIGRQSVRTSYKNKKNTTAG